MNNLILFLLYTMMLISFWYCVGYFLFSYNIRIKKLVYKYTFMDLFFIFSLLFLLLNLLQLLINSIFVLDNHIIDYFNTVIDTSSVGGSESLDSNVSNSSSSSNSSNTTSSVKSDVLSNNTSANFPSTSSNNSNNSNSSTTDTNNSSLSISSKIVTNAVNAAIIGASISAGMKIAQKSPTVAGKLATVGSTILMGGAAIGLKNTAENVSANLGKPRNFIGSNLDLNSLLKTMFNLTGNPGLDILNVILILQKMQIYLIIIIMYNLLFFFVTESTIENYLNKIFPIKLVNYIIKSIILLKNFNKYNIPALFLLLLISNLYTYYYLNFFFINIDEIIRLYF